MADRTDWQEFYAQRANTAQNHLLRAFYAAGIPAADTPLADVPFVAMDFETTGLDVNEHGIVSIGLIPFSLTRIRCNGARHWVVRPRQGLSSQSVVIHRITHAGIATAPDLSEIISDLLPALQGSVVVVHYRGIERSFLDQAFKARLDEGILFPVVDTMQIEADQVRGRALPWWRRIRRNPRQSIRLADSRARYGLPDYPPHHALTDALATAELFQAQVAHHFHPDTPVHRLWL